MNRLGWLLPTVLIASGLAGSANAATVLVDYTGAGAANYDTVSQSYGDSAEADLSYRSLNGGNNWGEFATQSANFVSYWNDANYSGDQAIFAVSNGNKLELTISAASGLYIQSLDFLLGSYPNVDRNIDFKIFNGAWDLIDEGTRIVDDALGATFAYGFSPLSDYSVIHIQFGDDWDVGVNSLQYTTARIDAPPSSVPLPAALPLLISAIGGLAFYGKRRRA